MSQVIVETRLDEIETEIKQHLKRQVDDVVMIGKLASEAKTLIPYGSFTEWIKAKLELTPRLIQGYMRVYERFGDDPKLFRKLKIASVLMLASPSTSEGAINEIKNRLEQGEGFSVEQVESVIDRYHVLEGAKIGSEALLTNFGTKPDGSLAPSISRSAVTSLMKVADEGLQHGTVTIDGKDHLINVTLPQSIIVATAQETSRRQSDHIDDNVVKKVRSQAVVSSVSDADVGTYVMLRVFDRSVFDQLGEGQQVTISFDVED